MPGNTLQGDISTYTFTENGRTLIVKDRNGNTKTIRMKGDLVASTPCLDDNFLAEKC